ncbi:GCN5-related N-acetyltransferase [Calothrix sp. NIES-4101]|nr:GCN5-related N-acetyltransferase [Calothrix sp. NIES-4101]
MKLYRFDSSQEFCDRIQGYLLQQEARHCLLFGIVDTLIRRPERYPQPPYLASVEEKEETVAVALMTPPYSLVLSCQDLQSLDVLIQDLYIQKIPLPGVNAPTTEAKTFAQAWQKLTGQSYKLKRQMRIHQLQCVQNVARTKGYLRSATVAERDFLIEWNRACEMEIFGEEITNAEHLVDYHLKYNTAYIWEDEIPVSLVCYAGSTPNGKRFGPVYTPPAYRQKGYATTAVAELSQKSLDMGYQFCCLYTDLKNPVSNHVYRKIGYEPVIDCCEYIFI